jgi:hypothetical protein
MKADGGVTHVFQLLEMHNEIVREVLEKFNTRIKQLETQLSEVSKSAPVYRGVWRSGVTYPKATFITHDGACWHANEETTTRPGGGNGCWTLAVKSGDTRR